MLLATYQTPKNEGKLNLQESPGLGRTLFNFLGKPKNKDHVSSLSGLAQELFEDRGRALITTQTSRRWDLCSSQPYSLHKYDTLEFYRVLEPTQGKKLGIFPIPTAYMQGERAEFQVPEPIQEKSSEFLTCFMFFLSTPTPPKLAFCDPPPRHLTGRA